MGENEAGKLSWKGADALPSRSISFVLIGLAALQSVLTSGMVRSPSPLRLVFGVHACLNVLNHRMPVCLFVAGSLVAVCSCAGQVCICVERSRHLEDAH